jgi:hypothetical protein
VSTTSARPTSPVTSERLSVSLTGAWLLMTSSVRGADTSSYPSNAKMRTLSGCSTSASASVGTPTSTPDESTINPVPFGRPETVKVNL